MNEVVFPSIERLHEFWLAELYKLPACYPFAIVLSSDGKMLFSAVNPGLQIQIIDTVRKGEIGEINVGCRPTSVAIVQEGKSLIVGSLQDQRLLSIDLSTQKIKTSWKVGFVSAVAIDPGDRLAYAAQISAYLPGTQPIISLGLSGKSKVKTSNEVTTDGDGVNAVNLQRNSLRRLTDATYPVHSFENRVLTMAVTRNSQHIVCERANGDVEIIDLPNGKAFIKSIMIQTSPSGSSIHGPTVLSPDDKLMYLINEGRDSVRVVNVDTVEPTIDIPLAGCRLPAALAISPNGAYVYVAGFDRVVKLDVRKGTVAGVSWTAPTLPSSP